MVALAAATAIATMAFASTTSANTPIEPRVESGGVCNVALQNCKFVTHSEGAVELVGHFIGIEATDSLCFEELTGYFGADGSGHIVDQVVSGPDCTREPCGGTEAEWPFRAEEIGANQLEMEVRRCYAEINEPSNEVHCSLNTHVDVTDHSNAEFAVDDTRCHAVIGTDFDVEVTGHWPIEPQESDEIEIVHL
jgi:hypothetical protein